MLQEDKLTNLGLLNVDITGRSSVGGLAGRNSNIITNSYVAGTVEGSGDQIGGLVGSNAVAITNSCASASVSGSGNQIGGLVGNSDLNSTHHQQLCNRHCFRSHGNQYRWFSRF